MLSPGASPTSKRIEAAVAQAWQNQTHPNPSTHSTLLYPLREMSINCNLQSINMQCTQSATAFFMVSAQLSAIALCKQYPVPIRQPLILKGPHISPQSGLKSACCSSAQGPAQSEGKCCWHAMVLVLWTCSSSSPGACLEQTAARV